MISRSADTFEPEPGCVIHVVNASEATGLRLHPAHTPCEWKEHQFATEWWLDRALTMATKRNSSWLVNDPEKADLIFIASHNFALWCVRQLGVQKDWLKSPEPLVRELGRACPRMNRSDHRNLLEIATIRASKHPGDAKQWPLHDANSSLSTWTQLPFSPPLQAVDRKPVNGLLSSNPFGKRLIWERLMSKPVLQHAVSRAQPIVVPLTNNECQPPWGIATALPLNVLKLHTQDRAPRRWDRVVPFSVATPGWLIGAPGASPPPTLPWAERRGRLLFFAGHVQKANPICTN